MYRLIVVLSMCCVVATLSAGCAGGSAQLQNAAGVAAIPVHSGSALSLSRHKFATASTNLVFTDNFSGDAIGGPAANWTPISGTWSVCQTGAVHAYCQTSIAGGGTLAGSSNWADYSVYGLVSDPNITFGGAGLIGRAVGPHEFYALDLKAMPNGPFASWNIVKHTNSAVTTLVSGQLTVPDANPVYNLALTFVGNLITASIAFDGGTNFQMLGSTTDNAYTSGQIGVESWGKTRVSLQSINVDLAALAPPSNEVPLAADSLTDSIGVNVGVNQSFTQPDWQTVMGLVRQLGVRHIRAGILNAWPAYNSAMAQMLATANAKLDGLTDCAGIQYYPSSPTSAASIQAFQAAIGNRIEFLEGPNEVDARNDASWVSDTIKCLPGLRGALPGVPFLAPTLADQATNATKLGNISQYVDLGNMHRYFSGRNPGTPGWGGLTSCGSYGSLPWNMCESSVNSGTKPIIITETGYGSGQEVDELTQAKYLSRAFFVHLKAGISHSYIYDFKDNIGGNGAAGLGLIRSDDSKKPAYTAIANEIAFFADPGHSQILSPLAFSVSNATLDHLLFQKNDGTYILALWNEALSWDPIAFREISVAPIGVNIVFKTLPISLAAVSINDSGGMAPSAVTTLGSSVTISVDDHVTLLSFHLP